jgi:mono/diheme cytochrome c family protein
MSQRSVSFALAFLFTLVGAVAIAAPTSTIFKLKGDAKAGKPVYVANCAGCHGEDGRGNGPMAKTLRPPPTDFTNGCFMAAVTDHELYTAVHKGGRAAGRGSGMSPWKERLTEQQIHDVVVYVRSLSKVPTDTICDDPESPTPGELKDNKKKKKDKPKLCPRVATR